MILKNHRHIPYKQFTITWHSKKDPTQEQLDILEKLANCALEKVENSTCNHPFTYISDDNMKICSACGETID